MWIFRFVPTHFAQNDNALVILNFAEQSEVSTNLKCEFAFLGRGFFAFYRKLKMTRVCRHCKHQTPKKFTQSLNFKALRLEKFLNRFLHSAWFVCVVDKLAKFRSPVNALSIGV